MAAQSYIEGHAHRRPMIDRTDSLRELIAIAFRVLNQNGAYIFFFISAQLPSCAAKPRFSLVSARRAPVTFRTRYSLP